MDRRSFLKTTAVGVGAAGSGSCAHLGTTLTSTSTGVLEMVNQLRATLDDIASPSAQVAAHPNDKLLRDGAQSLLLAGAFHSMAEDVRAHPAVQQLMLEKLAMMNTSAARIHQVAIASTPEERRGLTQELKEDPSLVGATAQGLDAEAVRLGLSGDLRVRLRGLFFQVGNRMKQSASLAIEEYSHKVARIEARTTEPNGFEREYIARMGEQSFWEFQARHEQYAAAWAGVAPVAGPSPPPLPVPVAAPVPEERGRAYQSARDAAALANDGSVALPLGASLFGIGILIGVGGGVLIATAGFVGAFVITAGALLFIAGIILMSVGGARAARAQRIRDAQ